MASTSSPFPEICHAIAGVDSQARPDAGLLEAQVHNIRDYAEGRHLVTDDLPMARGAGDEGAGVPGVR